MILPNDDRRIVKRSTGATAGRPPFRPRGPVTREFIPISFRNPFTGENQHLTRAITVVTSAT